LLGDQPALTPAESFYQRLIAGDPAEIIDQAEDQLTDRTLLDYYDDIALQGLILAQHDATDGDLSPERQTLLLESVTSLVDGLALAGTDNAPALIDGQHAASAALTELTPTQVLCIGGRGAVDQAAAALLAQLLSRQGIVTRLGTEREQQGLSAPPDPQRVNGWICVSYVGATRVAHVRFMVRRLRRKFPTAKILIGLWRMPADDPELQVIQASAAGDFYATAFRDAIGHLVSVRSLKSEPEFSDTLHDAECLSPGHQT
jgi:hypothetical protein